jgi:TolB-like protein/DNA-binding winged helix-turn-helix (wHTH) protein
VQRAEFGPFQLDLRTAELFKQGRKLRLSGQAAQLLVLLVQHAGELVTREELRAALWQQDTFVDFDHGLNNSVNRIREILGDSAALSHYVETLPKQGYRFMAEVCYPQPPQAAEPPLPLPADEALAVPAAHRRRLLVALSTVVLAGLAALLGWRFARPSSTPASIHSIAVLPLANLSGDSTQDYFADGVTEELITDLARLTTLRVTSRTSVMAYKGKPKPLPEIGRELGVDAVVEGAATRVGNHVRITAQLVFAPTDTHIWAEQYDYEVKDVLALQARVATDIAAHIQRSTAESHDAGLQTIRINPEAFEEYLKGQYFWRDGRTEMALRHFERATTLEPNYAAAYAGIAKTYCFREFYLEMPSFEAFSKASDAASKALRLDPNNSEAHQVVGFVLGQRDWDWDGTKAELQRAIALDPSNSIAHRWYSYVLLQEGRVNESVAQARLAHELDPLSAPTTSIYASRLCNVGLYDECIQQGLNAIELQPDSADLRFQLADYYEQSRKFDPAVSQLDAAYRLSGEPEISTQLQQLYRTRPYAYATESARRVYLQRELKKLDEKAAIHVYASPSAYALVYAGLHNREKTMDWLMDAYRQHSHVMIRLHENEFDFIRDDPRFQDLFQRVWPSH